MKPVYKNGGFSDIKFNSKMDITKTKLGFNKFTVEIDEKGSG